jgi:hypothetical protein
VILALVRLEDSSVYLVGQHSLQIAQMSQGGRVCRDPVPKAVMIRVIIAT